MQRVLSIFLLLLWCASATAGDVPTWLPQYEVTMRLDVAGRKLTGTERITFINHCSLAASEVVLNAYARYKIPDDQKVLLAKTLELLRSAPSDGIDAVGRRLTIHSVKQIKGTYVTQTKPIHFRWDEKIDTALHIPLDKPLADGEHITLELEFTLDIPEKEGRWGHRQGITFLTHWLPAVAYYDATGWQPTPFIAWHQPFFQEAGIYNVQLTLPKDQKVACTGKVQSEVAINNDEKMLKINGGVAREFSLVCSNRFEQIEGMAGKTKVKVLAMPEHAANAKHCLDVACEVIPMYNLWFGSYPFEEFTVVESHFAWNGNECSGLVMIDSRVMGLSPILRRYIDNLVAHETMHQWWYNIVGTNGYSETFMDEGVVCYYTAKYLQKKWGRNPQMLEYPIAQKMLPNVRFDDYRFYGIYGSLARGEDTIPVQDMEKYGNLVTLFSMNYDRGGKLIGMIEERIGPSAMMDFIRIIYQRYQFKVLRIRDFKKELEEYTGRNWDEFFESWLYQKGGTDWALQKATVSKSKEQGKGYDVSVTISQNAAIKEPTKLGVRFQKDGPVDFTIPIDPITSTSPAMQMSGAISQMTADGKSMTIHMTLPQEPKQLVVDPDQVLFDTNPSNNWWKPEVNLRFTPLLTPLDEADVTNAYDRWNITAGPWLGIKKPQFGQRMYAGARADVFRLQQFFGGAYVAWDAEDLDLRIGADAMLMHFPFPNFHIGAQYDHSITEDWASLRRDRGRLFARYVRYETPSMYLDSMEYLEAYWRMENRFGDQGRFVPQGVESYNDLSGVGLRWYRNYLTPYWDPEAGYKLDVNVEHGLPLMGTYSWYDRVQGEAVAVVSPPEGLGYLSQTRIAARAWGGYGWPSNGLHWQLGGTSRIRGLPKSAVEGDAGWIGSLEWRLPVWKEAERDFAYRLGVMKHLYAVAFYDAGEMYLNKQSVMGVVHSVGAGLRFDVQWLGFIERTTLRLDVAKSLNSNVPVQVWIGMQHAF